MRNVYLVLRGRSTNHISLRTAAVTQTTEGACECHHHDMTLHEHVSAAFCITVQIVPTRQQMIACWCWCVPPRNIMRLYLSVCSSTQFSFVDVRVWPCQVDRRVIFCRIIIPKMLAMLWIERAVLCNCHLLQGVLCMCPMRLHVNCGKQIRDQLKLSYNRHKYNGL